MVYTMVNVVLFCLSQHCTRKLATFPMLVQPKNNFSQVNNLQFCLDLSGTTVHKEITALLYFRTLPRIRVRAMVKLSATFFHDESSITIGGYESAIAPKSLRYSCCTMKSFVGAQSAQIAILSQENQFPQICLFVWWPLLNQAATLSGWR